MKKRKKKDPEYSRQYHLKNRDRILAASKERYKNSDVRKIYYEKNKERMNANGRVYYQKNRDKMLKQQREYIKNNPEKHEARRKKNEEKRLKLRFEIFARDNFTCRYCGRKPPEIVLEVDHVFPKSKGGKNEIKNYITSCRDCNLGKGDSILTEFEKN